MPHSQIIVSTVGLIPEIRSFLASRKAKLAVSLHATTDEVLRVCEVVCVGGVVRVCV